MDVEILIPTMEISSQAYSRKLAGLRYLIKKHTQTSSKIKAIMWKTPIVYELDVDNDTKYLLWSKLGSLVYYVIDTIEHRKILKLNCNTERTLNRLNTQYEQVVEERRKVSIS